MIAEGGRAVEKLVAPVNALVPSDGSQGGWAERVVKLAMEMDAMVDSRLPIVVMRETKVIVGAGLDPAVGGDSRGSQVLQAEVIGVAAWL